MRRPPAGRRGDAATPTGGRVTGASRAAEKSQVDGYLAPHLGASRRGECKCTLYRAMATRSDKTRCTFLAALNRAASVIRLD